jgi:hypothetical protein
MGTNYIVVYDDDDDDTHPTFECCADYLLGTAIGVP